MTDDPEPSLRDVLEAVNGRFDQLDERLDGVEDRLAALSETAAWAKMNIGMLAHTVAGIQAGVDQCRQDLARRDHRLAAIETLLARLSADIDLPETPTS